MTALKPAYLIAAAAAAVLLLFTRGRHSAMSVQAASVPTLPGGVRRQGATAGILAPGSDTGLPTDIPPQLTGQPPLVIDPQTGFVVSATPTTTPTDTSGQLAVQTEPGANYGFTPIAHDPYAPQGSIFTPAAHDASASSGSFPTSGGGGAPKGIFGQ